MHLTIKGSRKKKKNCPTTKRGEVTAGPLRKYNFFEALKGVKALVIGPLRKNFLRLH